MADNINAQNARIYGSELDAVYLAPLGTTLPTTIDGALDPAFEAVGWLNEDGITTSATGSVEKKRGFQGNGVVRTLMTEPGTTIAFVALETKKQTQELRDYVKASETAAGVRKSTVGAGQRIAKRACVIDLHDIADTTIKRREVIEVLEISTNGDVQYTSTEIAAYPFSGEVIGDRVRFETDTEGGV